MAFRWLAGKTVPIALFVAFATVASRADEPAKGSSEQDVVYTKAGSHELRLDVSTPGAVAADAVLPAVVVIHGGAWRAGNKADVRGITSELSKRRLRDDRAAVSVLPQGCIPGAGARRQGRRALGSKTNAKKYHVDPDRIGAMGFSAGGHLALMLGVTSPSDGLEGTARADAPDSRVKAVVNYFGPTDLAANDIPPISKPLVKDFLGGTPEDKPEEAAKASPLSFVSRRRRARAHVSGNQRPARALQPSDQACRRHEQGGHRGTGRAHDRRLARMGRQPSWNERSKRRSSSLTSTSRRKRRPRSPERRGVAERSRAPEGPVRSRI